MPRARAKLRIDVADVRAVNPDIIYVRGTGFGARGPEADTGGYDGTAFWARGGSADSVTPDNADRVVNQPTGAYGDNVGGMTIAGGIAAALYARATTGETSVVDVSLLGVGAWTTQFSVNLALRENGFVAEVTDYEGKERELVTNPVQFDEAPVVTRRAPQFAEHTDEIMRELGKNDDELIALKIAGAIT